MPQEERSVRKITEAIDEVYRELQVRKRIYGRWVQDQKLSLQEAIDRGERLSAALDFLLCHPLTPANYEPKDNSQEQIKCPF